MPAITASTVTGAQLAPGVQTVWADTTLCPGTHTVAEVAPSFWPGHVYVKFTDGCQQFPVALDSELATPAPPAPWTTTGPVEIAPGQIVVRWDHPSGARVDDNTRNDGGMDDLTPAQLAEHAWVGHTVTGWDEFPSFAEAAAYALHGPTGGK